MQVASSQIYRANQRQHTTQNIFNQTGPTNLHLNFNNNSFIRAINNKIMRQRMFQHLKGRITRINDQKPFNKFIHWISESI